MLYKVYFFNFQVSLLHGSLKRLIKEKWIYSPAAHSCHLNKILGSSVQMFINCFSSKRVNFSSIYHQPIHKLSHRFIYLFAYTFQALTPHTLIVLGLLQIEMPKQNYGDFHENVHQSKISMLRVPLENQTLHWL